MVFATFFSHLLPVRLVSFVWLAVHLLLPQLLLSLKKRFLTKVTCFYFIATITIANSGKMLQLKPMERQNSSKKKCARAGELNMSVKLPAFITHTSTVWIPHTCTPTSNKRTLKRSETLNLIFFRNSVYWMGKWRIFFIRHTERDQKRLKAISKNIGNRLTMATKRRIICFFLLRKTNKA